MQGILAAGEGGQYYKTATGGEGGEGWQERRYVLGVGQKGTMQRALREEVEQE